MQWIAEHRDVITALTGIGTLLVWVTYLHVFVSSYRRQLRATLLITRGAGDGWGARCFLSNMSSGPVYVESVLIEIETKSGIVCCPVTDWVHLEGDAAADSRRLTRQGPLASGETRDIGSFMNLIRDALHSRSSGPDAAIALAAVRCFEIKVLGLYSSEDVPIGARRRFVVLNEGGRARIQGHDLATKQIRKRRDRRRLVADLKQDL